MKEHAGQPGEPPPARNPDTAQIEAVMDIGVFQLLPRGRAATDREVVEQALWEVDFAERHGFESVWVTEHHFSGYGSIGVPSVYAAGIAQRTRRIRIGYAVAVVPLHHPLRLAEEISWVDHLSEGRVAVGVGPGFSPFEFGGFGVPVNERHVRFAEGFDVVRRALAEPEILFGGQRLKIRPRPYTQPHPPFYWASTSDESLRKAGAEGMPLLFGREPVAELAERLSRYRTIRAAAGLPEEAIDREIGEMYVLRRICIADTDAEALREVQEPLRWHREMGMRVHERGEAIDTVPTLAQGSMIETTDGECFGSIATVTRQLDELRALGLRKVIGWFHFGNMPHASVRRSMELMARVVIPRYRREGTRPC
jgi:alkanesulfonate monooxygenase SsuD/methylene tetrahydromethanopterin reductase-like flavin-dependent oxidoreductase (luciferase family)